MTIEVAPQQDPNQRSFVYAQRTTPYTTGWWTSQAVTEIPEVSVGWLVAQGWEVFNIDYDATTNPATAKFDLRRDSLNNWTILQSLLDEYIIAYNEATYTNATRYNDVVANWTQLSETSQDYAQTIVEKQNEHTADYLLNLDTYMSAVELLISDNEGDWNTTTASLATFLTQGQTDYDDFATDYGETLTQIDTDYFNFAPSYDVLLDQFFADYEPHRDLTRLLLTDLGTTELARINETFAASLATQTQQLIDQGLYTSAVLADITARNTRDRNEEIRKLNDGLNREHVTNEHQLYGQLTGVRDKKLTGTDRLYGQLTEMRGKTLAGKDRLEVMGQEITRWRHAQTLQGTEAETAARSRRIAELMSTGGVRLQGSASTHSDNIRIMQYTLDERNKLIVGLYGFVEKREDVFPHFESLVQIATGLGDAGGGWVTP